MDSNEKPLETQSSREIWLQRPTQTLFILGSGFTKAVFPEAPINDELMPQLVARNKSTKQLADLCKARGAETQDIEHALTLLDLWRTSPDDNVSDLRKEVEAEIADALKNFRRASIPASSHQWIDEFAKTAFCLDDVVVCLNYDLLLETLLRQQGLWSSNGGYGDQIPTARAFVGDKDFFNEPKGSPVTVLKIHGSINFCHKHSRAISGIQANCVSIDIPHLSRNDSEKNVALIAPSYVKKPPVEFSYMMLDALSKADQAKNLVILGCSLRPEDPFLSLLVTRFFLSSGYSTKEMLICGNDSESIRNRVVNYWSNHSRVLPLVKTLPKNLEKNTMQEYLCRLRSLREDRTNP